MAKQNKSLIGYPLIALIIYRFQINSIVIWWQPHSSIEWKRKNWKIIGCCFFIYSFNIGRNRVFYTRHWRKSSRYKWHATKGIITWIIHVHKTDDCASVWWSPKNILKKTWLIEQRKFCLALNLVYREINGSIRHRHIWRLRSTQVIEVCPTTFEIPRKLRKIV